MKRKNYSKNFKKRCRSKQIYVKIYLDELRTNQSKKKKLSFYSPNKKFVKNYNLGKNLDFCKLLQVH